MHIIVYEITHRPVIGVRGARVFESPQLSGGLRPARHFGFQNPAGRPQGRPAAKRPVSGRPSIPAGNPVNSKFKFLGRGAKIAGARVTREGTEVKTIGILCQMKLQSLSLN